MSFEHRHAAGKVRRLGIAPLRECEQPDRQRTDRDGPDEPVRRRTDCPDAAHLKRRKRLLETGNPLVEEWLLASERTSLPGSSTGRGDDAVEEGRRHRVARSEPCRERRGWPLDHRAFAIADDEVGRRDDLTQRRIDLRRSRFATAEMSPRTTAARSPQARGPANSRQHTNSFQRQRAPKTNNTTTKQSKQHNSATYKTSSTISTANNSFQTGKTIIITPNPTKDRQRRNNPTIKSTTPI